MIAITIDKFLRQPKQKYWTAVLFVLGSVQTA